MLYKGNIKNGTRNDIKTQRRPAMTRSQIAQLAAIRAHITINERKAKKARNFQVKSTYLAKAQALKATLEALTA